MLYWEKYYWVFTKRWTNNSIWSLGWFLTKINIKLLALLPGVKLSFKSCLIFWIQLLVSEILDKTNVRSCVIFEKVSNFGFIYTKLLNEAPLLFKASKSDLSIQQSSPCNLFRKHVKNSMSSYIDRVNLVSWGMMIAQSYLKSHTVNI